MQISGSNILKTMSPPTESRSLAQAPVFQKQPLLKLFVFFATGKALEMLSFYFWITVRQRIAAPGHSLRPLDLWGIQYCPPLSPSLSCLFSGQFTPTPALPLDSLPPVLLHLRHPLCIQKKLIRISASYSTSLQLLPSVQTML